MAGGADAGARPAASVLFAYSPIHGFPGYSSNRQCYVRHIFGATSAALALMRSIMEAVLRDHYGSAGKALDLNKRIRKARGRLPPGASEAALHRLRNLANAILRALIDGTK